MLALSSSRYHSPQVLATAAVNLCIRLVQRVGIIGGGYEIPIFVSVCFDIAGHAYSHDVDGGGAGRVESVGG